MRIVYCERCGSNKFTQDHNVKTCCYCGTKYQEAEKVIPQKKSSITLNDDVQRLLRMCEENPTKASKYAGLILDIDPTNNEALKYIRRK